MKAAQLNHTELWEAKSLRDAPPMRVDNVNWDAEPARKQLAASTNGAGPPPQPRRRRWDD